MSSRITLMFADGQPDLEILPPCDCPANAGLYRTFASVIADRRNGKMAWAIATDSAGLLVLFDPSHVARIVTTPGDAAAFGFEV